MRRGMGVVSSSLAILMLVALGVVAFAGTLTIELSKTTYYPGETVVVTGKTVPNSYVTVWIEDLKGNTVDMTVVMSDATGSFEAKFAIPSTIPYGNWKDYGTYKLCAEVGTAKQCLTFDVVPGSAVTGVVVDENGNPVAGATVTVVETGATTTTGANGKFVLGLTTGTYHIKISKPGYRSVELTATVSAGKITDLGTIRIVSYDYLISMLNTTVSSLQEKISELKTKLESLESAYADVSKSLDKISKSLDEIKNSLAALATAIESISGDISKLSSDVSKLSDTLTKVSGELDSVSGKIDALSSKIDGLKNQLTAIATGVSNNKAAIDALSKSVAQISTKLEDISSSIASVKADVSKVRSDVLDAVSSVASDVTAVKNAVSSLKTTVDSVSKSVSGLGAKIDAVKSSVEAKVGELTTLIVVTLILALIAAAASIYTTIQMVKKVAG